MSESVDKGAFTAGGYIVETGDGGSFVVVQGTYREDTHRLRYHRGFTNYRDLLKWLTEEHEINASGATEESKGQGKP